MRQAIDILQLPLLELRSFLDRELSENPLLEEIMPESGEELKSGEDIDRLVEELENDFSVEGQVYSNQAQRKKDFIEGILARPETLEEHLLSQLRILSLSESEREIGEMIIGSLDDNGYLRFSLNEIALTVGVDIRETERVLFLIQGLEPPGVGARNLEECLLIQLKAKGRSDSLASQIVRNYFFDLEMRRYEKIARSLGVSISEIKQARDEIVRLEPKPGRNFGQLQARGLVPDVVLQKENDGYRIENCAEDYLKLRVNPFYKKLLKQSNLPESTKGYLKAKLGSALWVIRSINQRQETIRKIVECIVNLQRDFLEKGPLYLRPLQLKDVANILGIHKSTVCRAIAGKHIQTPYGILELRYFFDEGIKNNVCQVSSSKSIKAWIENLINEEDSANPLSDEKIVQILQSQGIDIARRTVAKYREQLGILPSFLRKE